MSLAIEIPNDYFLVFVQFLEKTLYILNDFCKCKFMSDMNSKGKFEVVEILEMVFNSFLVENQTIILKHEVIQPPVEITPHL